MKKQIVALYGTNLIMSTIGASLQQKPEFQVQEIKMGITFMGSGFPPPRRVQAEMSSS